MKKDLDNQKTDNEEKLLSTIEEGPELGKHYMAFWFQTWTSKSRPISFMAARYCLNGLSARWLVVEIRKTIATLAFYGFDVTALGFDGATENRSAICQQLTLTIQDVFPELMRHNEVLKIADDEIDGDKSEVSHGCR